jgi:hypothetical protein
MDWENKTRQTLFLLVMGMLLIAPILPITFMAPRYLFTSSVVLFLTLFFVLDVVMVYLHPAVWRPVLVALVMLMFFNIAASFYFHSNNYGDNIVLQEKLIEFVKRDGARWKQDAQVVIVVDKLPRYSMNGYNHWSTWFLRYHTGRTDIVGLIGGKANLVEDPFVAKYRDHGSEFWTMRSGAGREMSVRRQMVGLTYDRPTYLYDLDVRTGSRRELEWLGLAADGQYRFRKANGNALDKEVVFPISMLPKAALQNGIDLTRNVLLYRIPRSPEPLPPLKAAGIKGMRFDSDRPALEEVLTTVPKTYSIELLLKTDIAVAKDFSFSRTSPPMPVLIPPLAIYQASESTFNVRVGRDNAVDFRFAEADKWHHIALTVHDGQVAVLYVNGKPVSSGAGELQLVGRIAIGKGFLDRRWDGWIRYVRVSDGIRYEAAFDPVLHPGSDDATIYFFDGTEGSVK